MIQGRVDLSGKPAVIALDPKCRCYGRLAADFQLSPDRGHKLLLRFHATSWEGPL